MKADNFRKYGNKLKSKYLWASMSLKSPFHIITFIGMFLIIKVIHAYFRKLGGKKRTKQNHP